MKPIQAIPALALLAILAPIALAQSEAPEARSERAVLQVYGMQSPMCEMGVRQALSTIQGVHEVTVDREAGKATTLIDPSQVSVEQLVAAVESIGFRAIPTRAPDSHAVSTNWTPELTDAELDTVAAYVARVLIDSGELPTGAEVLDATGIRASVREVPLIQSRVVAKLAEDPLGQKLLAGSRCSDYGACSLHGNLAGASDGILAMYEVEKAQDGRRFDDLRLPEFEALDLSGEVVSSTDLVGRPAVLAFLAVHCNHSLDTLPILQELHDSYGSQGVRIVGIFINSGSVEDLNYWLPRFEPRYEIWAYGDTALGDVVGSHLVPTYLFVDSRGRVTQKLVGFKPLEAVTEWTSLNLRSDTTPAAAASR